MNSLPDDFLKYEYDIFLIFLIDFQALNLV